MNCRRMTPVGRFTREEEREREVCIQELKPALYSYWKRGGFHFEFCSLPADPRRWVDQGSRLPAEYGHSGDEWHGKWEKNEAQIWYGKCG